MLTRLSSAEALHQTLCQRERPCRQTCYSTGLAYVVKQMHSVFTQPMEEVQYASLVVQMKHSNW